MTAWRPGRAQGPQHPDDDLGRVLAGARTQAWRGARQEAAASVGFQRIHRDFPDWGAGLSNVAALGNGNLPFSTNADTINALTAETVLHAADSPLAGARGPEGSRSLSGLL